MGPDGFEGQHDARVVEIVVGLLLGVLVGVAVLVAVWLFGWLAAPPRELWDPVIAVIRPVAVGSGGLALVVWLFRSSRRGP